MIRMLTGGDQIRTDAPRFVEILQWEKDGNEYLGFVNEQEESPVARVSGIQVLLPGRRVRAELMPGGNPLPAEQTEEGTLITLPELGLLQVVLLAETDGLPA